MEQKLTIGNGEVITYEFEHKKEVEVDNKLWFSTFLDNSIRINDSNVFDWQMTKEDLCTFIKLLISHLELPLEVK